jgi:hypothetical protein
MNAASNTRLRLNYPSWSRPRSHWSATDPRNQQTTFGAKTLQLAQRKLARLAACAAPVRPVDRAGQAGGCSSRTTNVPESLSDFSRTWNQNTPKNTTCKKEEPFTNQAKHLQNSQDLTSTNTTQRHTDSATHPRQIPQRVHTSQTGQEHRSDWCNLGRSG